MEKALKNIELCQAGVLEPFVKCLNRRGIPADRYLEQSRISPELVASGDGMIVKKQAWHFFEDVERREGIPSLGFLDGDTISIDDLGSLGRTLQRAVTLKDAIDTFVRLVPAFAEGNNCWLQREKEVSWLWCSTRGLARSARVADHYTIVVLREVIRLAASGDWEPSAIRLYSDAGKSSTRISQLTDKQVWFEQDATGIAFPSRLLGMPVAASSESNAFAQAEELEIVDSTNIVDALHTVLSSFIKYGALPNVEEAAEIIGVSRVSLYRALKAEGASYRRLSERVRFDLARHLLKDQSLSVKQVSFAVGYAHQTSFVRSFRQLSGYTPTEFRHISDS